MSLRKFSNSLKIMCLHPTMIKNVNYGYTSTLGSIADTTSQYIPVPCGRCSVCLQLKQQYLVQRVQMEALSHDLYFGTLTYNNESLPVLEVDDFKLNYSDVADFQSMIKMIRKHEHLPSFKYFCVTEYGGRKHRPHFHFILSFPKDVHQTLADRWSFAIRLHFIFLRYWRRNVNILPDKFTKSGKPKVNTRSPKWQNLCTYYRTRNSYNFDLHYLDPTSSSDGLDSVSFYVSKYCLKFDKWVDKLKSKLFFSLDEDSYKETWNIIRPKRLLSKGFGSPEDPCVIEHINKGIEFSLNDPKAIYPYFISPVNGSTFPLSPYFSKKFLRLDDLLVFNSRKPRLTDYDMMLDSSSDLQPYEVLEKERKFNVIVDHLDSVNTMFDECASSLNDIHLSNYYLYAKTSSFDDDVFDPFAFDADC